jgi:hypothetical protein
MGILKRKINAELESVEKKCKNSPKKGIDGKLMHSPIFLSLFR